MEVGGIDVVRAIRSGVVVDLSVVHAVGDHHRCFSLTEACADVLTITTAIDSTVAFGSRSADGHKTAEDGKIRTGGVRLTCCARKHSYWRSSALWLPD
jgi:hypothetical protein